MSRLNIKWTENSQERIRTAREQGTLGVFAAVPVAIEALHWIEVQDELQVTLRANVRIKDATELAANPTCGNCKGRGWVQYWYAQDESRVGRCHVCFPNDQEAKRAHEAFNEWSR